MVHICILYTYMNQLSRLRSNDFSRCLSVSIQVLPDSRLSQGWTVPALPTPFLYFECRGGGRRPEVVSASAPTAPAPAIAAQNIHKAVFFRHKNFSPLDFSEQLFYNPSWQGTAEFRPFSR